MHDTALISIEKIKLVLSATLAVVLAVALSMQASFVSINTMSCNATGKKMVAVGEFDSCCALDIEDFGIEKSACLRFPIYLEVIHIYISWFRCRLCSSSTFERNSRLRRYTV